MADRQYLFDKDKAEEVFKEVLNTPQTYEIDFHYTAELDSVPTAEYTVKRYVFNNEGKKVNG